MKKSAVIISLTITFLLVVSFLSGCSDSKSTSADKSSHSSSSGKKVAVKVTKDGFSPESVNVKPGDTVVWENDSDVDAQIHEDNGSPADIIGPGQTYEAMYHENGSIAYHNHLKSTMAAQIVVE